MSGFQQDQNQLKPAFYRIAINLAGLPSADGTNNGALFTQDHSQFVTKPSDMVNSRRLARGQLRFLGVIEELSKYSDVQILDVEFTSADITNANNQPTEVKLTAKYDRNDNILPSVISSFGANDSSGAVIVTVQQSIKQLVTNGVTRGGVAGYKRRVRVWQMPINEESDEYIIITQPDTPANIFGKVSVLPIDGTTLTNI